MNKDIPVYVKVLKCDYPEFIGQIVEVYHFYLNGVDFVTKYGLVFLPKGHYEEVKE